MNEYRKDWNLTIVGVGLALIGILIGRAVWIDADRTLERAKADYAICLEEAQDTSQCERDWQEAQDAYPVP